MRGGTPGGRGRSARESGNLLSCAPRASGLRDGMTTDFAHTRYSGPTDSIGHLLYQLAGLWRRQMNARLDAVGLTYIQFVFLIRLAWLTQDGRGITQKTLGQDCKTSRALTSQVVRLLERNKLIRQAVKPGDARARLLKLTAEGQRRLARALPLLEVTEDAFLGERPALKRGVRDDLQRALAQELAKAGPSDLDSGPD